MNVQFINDNNVMIILPDDHLYTRKYITRINQEKWFRLIVSFLINNNYITGNIIDLGAWIGDNSIPWAKNIKGIVYAIDPSTENCEYIETLRKLNNINNLEIINKVICDTTRIVSTNENLHHCTFQTNNLNLYKMESTNLDNLFLEGKIKNISLIHLDVEGMEGLIIDGCEKILEMYNPIICFEQHIETDNYIQLVNKLKLKGYIVYLINETFPECRRDCRNLLAIPLNKQSDDFKSKTENFLDLNEILIDL